MPKRKDKPTKIYREEWHGCGLFNSTTQSFTKPIWLGREKEHTARVLQSWPEAEMRYFVGEITWTEVTDNT